MLRQKIQLTAAASNSCSNRAANNRYIATAPSNCGTQPWRSKMGNGAAVIDFGGRRSRRPIAGGKDLPQTVLALDARVPASNAKVHGNLPQPRGALGASRPFAASVDGLKGWPPRPSMRPRADHHSSRRVRSKARMPFARPRYSGDLRQAMRQQQTRLLASRMETSPAPPIRWPPPGISGPALPSSFCGS